MTCGVRQCRGDPLQAPCPAYLFSTDRMAVQAFFSLWARRESVANSASVRSSS